MHDVLSLVADDLLTLPPIIRITLVPTLRGPLNRRRRHVELPTSADPQDRSRRRLDYPAVAAAAATAAAARQRDRNRARRTITIMHITITRAAWNTTESISSTSPATKNPRKSRGIKIISPRYRVKSFEPHRYQ